MGSLIINLLAKTQAVAERVAHLHLQAPVQAFGLRSGVAVAFGLQFAFEGAQVVDAGKYG
ncbi:hypothetical protein D3C78_1899460 [compost metagenome]